MSRGVPDAPFVNLDIGGGTANLAWGQAGEVSRVGCYLVGARHVQVIPGTYQLLPLSPFALQLFEELKIQARSGDAPDSQAKAAQFSGHQEIRFEYTVVSNNYSGGVPSVEAGSLLAEKVAQWRTVGDGGNTGPLLATERRVGFQWEERAIGRFTASERPPGTEVRNMAKKSLRRHQMIPAVAYLRRSTSRQEKSLDDQRTEIERYAAANGYRILRWFQDDGISGDATERRTGFLALHKSACDSRDFDAILVWDQDRFGRFDSMEAGYWIHPLRKAGVGLVSVTEGPINWDDFTGRVMYSLKQEGKHQFLRDLSRNVSRGQISNAQKGLLCGQAAPYGYDRMLVDERGDHRQRIRTGEKFTKARGWRTTLVPSDEALKICTVRWLFQTYADTDTGLRNLADQLNGKGVPGPTGGPWYAASIKAILENRNYTGTFTWAKRREGKYHSVAAGQIRERDRAEVTLSPSGKPHAVDNPREAWIVVEDAHEAIIDTALFERVQAKLQDRRRSIPGAAYRTHTRGNGDSYLLAGLVYCAHCGCKMHGSQYVAKGNLYRKYFCSTYCRSGKNNPHGCGSHAISQDRLVDVLVRKLQELVLTTYNLDRLRTALRTQLNQRRMASFEGSGALRKQLSELNVEIDLAATNFLRAPAEVLDLIGEKLTALKRRRDCLHDELKRANSAEGPRDIDTEVEAIVDRLWRLGQDMTKAEPARRREVFRLLVRRIELRFGHVKRGKRTECPLQSGEIHLRTEEEGIFGSVSRGERI